MKIRSAQILTAVALIAGAARTASAADQSGAANAAHADSDPEVTRVKVAFADLNLATPKGTKALYIRLQNAADAVCGDDLYTVNLVERRQINRCYQEAIESAVARVDRPLLTALYDRRFPHEPLTGTSRVSYAPGEASAPIRVEVIELVPRRG